MKFSQDALLRHLVIAVALKLAVLVVLWWAFVQDGQTSVDVERAAARLGAPDVANPSTSTSSGAPL